MRKTKLSRLVASIGGGADGAKPDESVLTALKDWRRQEAARREVPAYVVLHDRTLAAIAAARPATLDALADIPGIGPGKLTAYGTELLSLLAHRAD